MNQYHSLSKQPKTILKGYQMFLVGSDDPALADAEVSRDEITKIKKFHECMLAGQTFCVSGKKLGLSEHISKRLWHMYCDSVSGKAVTYIGSSRENCPHVSFTYSLLLQGASDDELREAGCTEIEIEKAKLYSRYADADMLPKTLSQRTGIVVSTIKRMQKIRKERSKLAELKEQPEMIAVR